MMENTRVPFMAKKTTKFTNLNVCKKGSSKTRDVPRVGFMLDGESAWYYSGSSLKAVNCQDRSVFTAFDFSSETGHPNTKISVVTEYMLPCDDDARETHVPLLVVSYNVGDTDSYVSFFHARTTRVLRTILVEGKVTSLTVISLDGNNAPVSDILRMLDDALVIGMEGGKMYIMDIKNYALQNRYNPPRISLGREEDEICSLMFVDIDGRREDIRSQITQNVSANQHAAFVLNRDRTRHDESERADRETKRYSHISTLMYMTQNSLLAVGFSNGIFQLWNMKTLSRLYTSSSISGRPPVVRFSFQEPCDDPHHCCYLWVVFDANSHLNMPFAMMYSLMFEQKNESDLKFSAYQNSSLKQPLGDISLQNYERCKHSFTMNLADSDSYDGRFITSHVVSNTSSNSLERRFDNQDSSKINLFILIHESWYHREPDSTSSVNITVFDLNRWYSEQIPDDNVNSPCDGYQSCVVIDNSSSAFKLQDVYIMKRSLQQFLTFNSSEQHRDPSSLSFEALFLTENEVVHIEVPGVQKHVLDTIEEKGHLCLLRPREVYDQCRSAKLQPSFIADLRNYSSDEVFMREFVLTVLLEHQRTNVLINCIRSWADGKYAQKHCGLEDFITWMWNSLSLIKNTIQGLCTPLFDYTGIEIVREDYYRLKDCVQLIHIIWSLLNIIYTQHQRFVIFTMESLKKKLNTVRLLREYYRAALWCLDNGLLPERLSPGSTNTMGTLKQDSEDRRNHLRSIMSVVDLPDNESPFFFIDMVIKDNSCYENICDLWHQEERNGAEVGCYPPSTLQDALRIYLLPKLPMDAKHKIVMYYLMDVLKNQKKPDTALFTFPASLESSPRLISLIKFFWLMDHGQFEEATDTCFGGKVKKQDMNSKFHRRVILILLQENLYELAFRYANFVQLSLSDLSNCLYQITVLLHHNAVSEALEVARKNHFVRDKLLRNFFRKCFDLGLEKNLLDTTYTRDEETALLSYLDERKDSKANDIKVFYLLSRARYAEALENNIKDRRKLMKNPMAMTRGGQRSFPKDLVMSVFEQTLPAFTKDLMKYSKDQNSFNAYAKSINPEKPTPLFFRSICKSENRTPSYKTESYRENGTTHYKLTKVLQNTGPPRKPTTRDMIFSAMAKTKEILDNCKLKSATGPATTKVQTTPFLRREIGRKRKLNEHESLPAKRRKIIEHNTEHTDDDDAVDKEMLSTPFVEKRAPGLHLSATPKYSILKTTSLLKSKPAHRVGFDIPNPQTSKTSTYEPSVSATVPRVEERSKNFQMKYQMEEMEIEEEEEGKLEQEKEVEEEKEEKEQEEVEEEEEKTMVRTIKNKKDAEELKNLVAFTNRSSFVPPSTTVEKSKHDKEFNPEPSVPVASTSKLDRVTLPATSTSEPENIEKSDSEYSGSCDEDDNLDSEIFGVQNAKLSKNIGLYEFSSEQMTKNSRDDREKVFIGKPSNISVIKKEIKANQEKVIEDEIDTCDNSSEIDICDNSSEEEEQNVSKERHEARKVHTAPNFDRSTTPGLDDAIPSTYEGDRLPVLQPTEHTPIDFAKIAEIMKTLSTKPVAGPSGMQITSKTREVEMERLRYHPQVASSSIDSIKAQQRNTSVPKSVGSLKQVTLSSVGQSENPLTDPAAQSQQKAPWLQLNVPNIIRYQQQIPMSSGFQRANLAVRSAVPVRNVGYNKQNTRIQQQILRPLRPPIVKQQSDAKIIDEIELSSGSSEDEVQRPPSQDKGKNLSPIKQEVNVGREETGSENESGSSGTNESEYSSDESDKNGRYKDGWEYSEEEIHEEEDDDIDEEDYDTDEMHHEDEDGNTNEIHHEDEDDNTDEVHHEDEDGNTDEIHHEDEDDKTDEIHHEDEGGNTDYDTDEILHEDEDDNAVYDTHDAGNRTDESSGSQSYSESASATDEDESEPQYSDLQIPHVTESGMFHVARKMSHQSETDNVIDESSDDSSIQIIYPSESDHSSKSHKPKGDESSFPNKVSSSGAVASGSDGDENASTATSYIQEISDYGSNDVTQDRFISQLDQDSDNARDNVIAEELATKPDIISSHVARPSAPINFGAFNFPKSEQSMLSSVGTSGSSEENDGSVQSESSGAPEDESVDVVSVDASEVETENIELVPIESTGKIPEEQRIGDGTVECVEYVQNELIISNVESVTWDDTQQPSDTSSEELSESNDKAMEMLKDENSETKFVNDESNDEEELEEEEENNTSADETDNKKLTAEHSSAGEHDTELQHTAGESFYSSSIQGLCCSPSSERARKELLFNYSEEITEDSELADTVSSRSIQSRSDFQSFVLPTSQSSWAVTPSKDHVLLEKIPELPEEEEEEEEVSDNQDEKSQSHLSSSPNESSAELSVRSIPVTSRKETTKSGGNDISATTTEQPLTVTRKSARLKMSSQASNASEVSEHTDVIPQTPTAVQKTRMLRSSSRASNASEVSEHTDVTPKTTASARRRTLRSSSRASNASGVSEHTDVTPQTTASTRRRRMLRSSSRVSNASEVSEHTDVTPQTAASTGRRRILRSSSRASNASETFEHDVTTPRVRRSARLGMSNQTSPASEISESRDFIPQMHTPVSSIRRPVRLISSRASNTSDISEHREIHTPVSLRRSARLSMSSRASNASDTSEQRTPLARVQKSLLRRSTRISPSSHASDVSGMSEQQKPRPSTRRGTKRTTSEKSATSESSAEKQTLKKSSKRRTKSASSEEGTVGKKDGSKTGGQATSAVGSNEPFAVPLKRPAKAAAKVTPTKRSRDMTEQWVYSLPTTSTPLVSEDNDNTGKALTEYTDTRRMTRSQRRVVEQNAELR